MSSPCQGFGSRSMAGESTIKSKLLVDLEKKAAESFLYAERNSKSIFTTD